jgi:hypothetical protein
MTFSDQQSRVNSKLVAASSNVASEQLKIWHKQRLAAS